MNDLLRHGTYKAYFNFRCRCLPCATYQRDRVARNRAERKAAGRLSHGTRSAWDAGCRCERCLAVKRDADRRDWRSNREARNASEARRKAARYRRNLGRPVLSRRGVPSSAKIVAGA